MPKNNRIPIYIWRELKKTKKLINRHRKNNKMCKIRYNNNLREAAYHHAKYMAINNITKLEQDPHNEYKVLYNNKIYKEVYDRVKLYNGKEISCGENIMIQHEVSPEKAIQWLKNSKSHNDNMLDPSFNSFGCAYYIKKEVKIFKTYNRYFWVHVFGKI